MSIQHTMVPYLWRRHLAVLRVLLAFLCVVVYLLYRVPYSIPIAVIICGYGAYGGLLLFREPIESSLYPVPLLFFDLACFAVSALHPSPQGLWLSTVWYFYLLCVSALLYSWRNVATVVLLCLLFFLALRPHPAFLLWATIVFGGVLAIVLSIQKEAFQQRLSAALKRSVISRYEAEAAREAERQRIGADFHDGPLQSFISFQMRLEIIRKLMSRDPEAAHLELTQLQDLGKSQVAELRAFIRNMQPVEVDEAGLAASIREITGLFQRDTGISVNLETRDLDDPASQDVATEVLQIVREILNNVRKHSRASQVFLAAASRDGIIEIDVQDDGSGFPFCGAFTLEELEAARLGPKSIKRRIRTLGGQMTLDSRPSEGAGMKIRIPA